MVKAIATNAGRLVDTQLLGRDAAGRWLAALELQSVPRWHVEVALDNGHHTRFHLNIYAEEWGFAFHHARRSSWIRVTDAPFVHGRDDFGLLASTPDLATLNAFLAQLETKFAIVLRRSDAAIRTNIAGAARAVRGWLMHSVPAAAEHICGDEMHDEAAFLVHDRAIPLIELGDVTTIGARAAALLTATRN